MMKHEIYHMKQNILRVQKFIKHLRSIFHAPCFWNSGLGLVEMIVVVALIASSFTAILQLVVLERRTQNLASEELGAYMLAREALEAARSVRDGDWAAFAALQLETAYYPVLFNSTWQLSAQNPGPVGIYTKWIELDPILRDGSDNIVASGGITDSNSRRVSSHVAWTTAGGGTRAIELETLLTNWQAFK